MIKYLKALFTDPKIYILAGGLIVLGVTSILLFDRVLMPNYTMHSESLTVPDVTRVSLEEAEDILEDHGLRYELHGKRSNDAYPPDFVIDQTPSASFQVKPNRKVYLTINTTESPTVTVPELINLSQRNAEIQLQNHGLSVGMITMESSRYKNSVLKQSVTPGRSVEQGTVVDLVIGDGLGDRLVELPDLTGLSLSEAQEQLNDAELRTGSIEFKKNDEYAPGFVLSFSDNNQDRVYEGTTIDLVVSEKIDSQEESESAPLIEDD
ncbi:MAG: PASTA domain-containing protein [Balneolales bacterium]